LLAYHYCGSTVASNILIPELTHSESTKGEYIFHLESVQPHQLITSYSEHWLSPLGDVMLSYGSQGVDHWLQFPGVAEFRISNDTFRIMCFPFPQTSEATIRHLFLDQVMPRCLAYNGRIMLHASAVLVGQGLLLFLGDSGAGKSTIAGNFHAAGNPALSDDCVWLKKSKNQIGAVPTYSGLRLWDDSIQALFPGDPAHYSMADYSDKKRVRISSNTADQFDDGIPILALILLSLPSPKSTSTLMLNELPNRDKYIALLKQTFQLTLKDLDRVSNHALALGSIVPRLKMFRLSMPRDYKLLPVVRQRILGSI
jgi:hypothetical protein